MGHFWAQNQHFYTFLLISSLYFLDIYCIFLTLWLVAVVKKWLKPTLWIFKEQNIFGPKNAKNTEFHKFCSLDFSEILFDEKKAFLFFKTTLIMPQKPLLGFFSTELTYFMLLVSFLCFS